MEFQICRCGTQSGGYPHTADCPFPFFGRDAATLEQWTTMREIRRLFGASSTWTSPILYHGYTIRGFSTTSGKWDAIVIKGAAMKRLEGYPTSVHACAAAEEWVEEQSKEE
jgi:hypothetical protein